MEITRKELGRIAANKKWGGNTYAEAFRDALNDVFARHARPGAYTVIFQDRGEILCADCAKKAYLSRDYDLDQGIYSGLYDEGPSEYCYECGEEIQASYGDPEEEENNDD